MLALCVTLVLWASAFPAIRAAVSVYPPGQLALLRFLVASAALAAWAPVSGIRRPEVRDLPAVLVSGLLGVTIYHVALNQGETTVTAGAASLLVGTVPVFSSLLATAFLGERLGPGAWAGIGVSFAGVTLVGLGEAEGVRFDSGAFLVLLAAISQSLYFILQKPLLRRYTPLEFASYSIWAGTALLSVFAPGLGGQLEAAPFPATVAAVYLGIFPGALAYVTWARVLARTPASEATSFLYLVPVLAIGIGWAWLGELPTTPTLLGGIATLAGVALVVRRH